MPPAAAEDDLLVRNRPARRPEPPPGRDGERTKQGFDAHSPAHSDGVIFSCPWRAISGGNRAALVVNQARECILGLGALETPRIGDRRTNRRIGIPRHGRQLG